MDLANVQQHFSDILYGVSREAPAVFKAHDHYFMLVSGGPLVQEPVTLLWLWHIAGLVPPDGLSMSRGR